MQKVLDEDFAEWRFLRVHAGGTAKRALAFAISLKRTSIFRITVGR